jgi:hypothetical protein
MAVKNTCAGMSINLKTRTLKDKEGREMENYGI